MFIGVNREGKVKINSTEMRASGKTLKAVSGQSSGTFQSGFMDGWMEPRSHEVWV